jgi:hypothetical protein
MLIVCRSAPQRTVQAGHCIVKLGMLLASLEHLPQYAHQSAVLQGSCHSLFVSQLLVHLLVGAMCALLDAHIDAEAGRQSLLEPGANAQANDRGKGAVSDCRRDLHDHGADGRKRGRRREDVDVWQVYHG